MSGAITTEPRAPARRENIQVVYGADTIAARVTALGAEITAAYPDGDLVVIGLLRGGWLFVSDLIRAIDRPLQLDFMVVGSYGANRVSSGTVEIGFDPGTKLAGCHVLVVDDIIETGMTMAAVTGMLRDRNPRSLSVCALLDKNLAAEPLPELRWVGFNAGPEFLVGYGLDHAERFRHLPFIGRLTDA